LALAVSDVAERTVCIALDPPLKLRQWDQEATAAADHPEVVQDMLLEEFDADAKCVGSLGARER
jgi:hypothetical protein